MDTRGFTLITGAAQGIGRAFAKQLAARAEQLVLVDVRAENLPELAEQVIAAGAPEAHYFAQNLAVEDAACRVHQFCHEHNLHVSTLINNAAIGTYSPLQKQALSRMEEMIRVNVSAPVALTRLFLPGMLRRGTGTIVNVTSISAWERSPLWSVYGGTKAFLQSFTESLQDELEGTDIYVTSVCPGLTRTSFFDSAGVECPENVQDPDEVVAEALAGIDRRQPLIVTGRTNRIRIHAQRANLRRLLAGVRGGLRRVGVLS